VVDENGGLLNSLNSQGYFWSRGGTVTYRDLYLKMDQIAFEPGNHMTGQITVTCADDIVFALMNLQGPRTASNISATEWISQELRLCGLDPSACFLGESVPTQSVIARDEADQASTSGTGDQPSAWTTIVRLAKELGKRVFISGTRLVFGSAGFATAWTAPGAVRLSYSGYGDGERFLSLPSVTWVTVGSRQVMQIEGRIPLNRAPYFRPGVAVLISQIPGAIEDTEMLMMCSHLTHDLGTDTAGADITLLEPVDPPPQPPTSTADGINSGSTSTGGTSGGGADGQVDRFVALALQQAGKAYVYGAEASPSDPNPRAFDCSELVQWCADRVGISPAVPDGSAAQLSHCQSSGTLVSVQDGTNTKGALLFMPGHVAISLGNGKTIEAMDPKDGVRQGNAAGRGWTAAGRIPGAQGYR
jgi:cell wall-associated NlpC family hydrolase